ncbi:substrate-binding periplasmic protein [Aliidiomarina haloalkalitolerans]|uniref:Amino acid ABC transporter substrate-binding protein n=1 Tax=Aliidiomarina haloalkalitolerans TaxID=859059 RepID=A0A432VYC5_9GAMM|nr:transporter substrate-binding domain-containing protein [Aliidiomarina haloalkalitolerans]RUO21667.1 amino acid ABC transporter substrate-binding protein [Aliidiomarina haloalkalitolerans]
MSSIRRSWLLLIATLVLLVGCSPNSNTVDSGPYRSDSTGPTEVTLKVLYVNADGFAFRNEQGELTGVTVDIMHEFVRWFERYHAARINLNFVEEENWSVFYQRIRNASGGVFGLGNVTITEARRQELQFSPPYMTNVAVLISPAETAELTSFDEFPQVFTGLQPMAFAGTLHETRIKQLRDRYQPDAEVRAATSNPEIIEAVASGHYYSYIDAYNYWRAVAGGAAIRHHSIADDPGETFGIIMPLDNDWAPLLTAFFAAEGGFTLTERYREIMHEHLGENLANLLLEAAR